MRESAIEDPVVLRAREAGYFTRKVSWVGRRSAPDDLFARADRGIVFIEFKAPGEKPTTLQLREHERMREAGIEVHVCDNITHALRVLWLTNE